MVLGWFPGSRLRTLTVAFVVTAGLTVSLLACSSDSEVRGTLGPELEALADDTESKGWLRPIFPSYVPDELDEVPDVFDGSRQHVAFVFGGSSDSGATHPIARELVIVETSPPDFLPSCPVDPDDTIWTCVPVGGTDANLQVTDQGNEGVDYHLVMEFNNTAFDVTIYWDRRGTLTDEMSSAMLREIIRIAESLLDE